MINLISKFRDLIIVAFLAFSLGGAATFFPTKTHYVQKYELVIKERELAAERKLGQAESAARLTERNINVEKENLESTKNKAIADLQKRMRDLRRPVAGSPASVYVDPGKTYGGVPKADNPSTTSTNPADSGRLSDETREFLLDYAEDAEITRRDLITCRAFNDALRSHVDAYNRELDSIYNIKASKPTSSGQ